MTMTKEQIKTELSKYVTRMGSQNKASKMLNVSNATISNLLADKHENISADLWRSIGKQLGVGVANGWVWVENDRTRMIKTAYENARLYADVYGIVADAGQLKTSAARKYAGENENVYLVECSEYMNRKSFLVALLRAMGREVGGSIADMMESVVEAVLRTETPVIILDEADKLTDQVLLFFITIYNKTEGKCGLIIQGTDYLQYRIMRGYTSNKRGYREIYSRLGNRFMEIKKLRETDLRYIITANGIDDELMATRIINECAGSVRQLKKMVQLINRQSHASN